MYGLRTAGPRSSAPRAFRSRSSSLLNALGALLWSACWAGAGYVLGKAAEHILGDLARVERELFGDRALVLVVVLARGRARVAAARRASAEEAPDEHAGESRGRGDAERLQRRRQHAAACRSSRGRCRARRARPRCTRSTRSAPSRSAAARTAARAPAPPAVGTRTSTSACASGLAPSARSGVERDAQRARQRGMRRAPRRRNASTASGGSAGRATAAAHRLVVERASDRPPRRALRARAWSRAVSASRYAPAIIDTAAAIAPVMPATSTIRLSLVLAATPNTRPKIETVPSSMPNTMSPNDALNERRCGWRFGSSERTECRSRSIPKWCDAPRRCT